MWCLRETSLEVYLCVCCVVHDLRLVRNILTHASFNSAPNVTGPRCLIPYCSLDCFRKHGQECTEQFAQAHVADQVAQEKAARSEFAKVHGSAHRLAAASRPLTAGIPGPEVGAQVRDDADISNSRVERRDTLVEGVGGVDDINDCHGAGLGSGSTYAPLSGLDDAVKGALELALAAGDDVVLGKSFLYRSKHATESGVLEGAGEGDGLDPEVLRQLAGDDAATAILRSFERSLASGRVSRLVQAWDPWWKSRLQ